MTLRASEYRQRRVRDHIPAVVGYSRAGYPFLHFFLFAWLLWAVSAQAVEFPGPVSLSQDGASLSAAKVRLPGTDRDYFVSGSSGGFLNLNRFNPVSRNFTILHRFYVGGEMVAITPWLGLPAQETGLVVAAANPDRLLFVMVNDAFPYLTISKEVALEEDPGSLAFLGNALTEPWEIGVTLPGTDRVVFLAENGGQWTVQSTVDSGDRPASLVGVDLDGDGIRELVVVNAGPLSGTLGIYRRQPDASYSLETVTLPTATPALVTAYDLDNDGRRELAVALSDQPQVRFYNEVAGSLVEVDRVDLTLTANAMHLNMLSDGTPGLFTASFERGLVEFSSLGGGQWTRLDTYYPGCRPHDFTFVDLDGDSLDDLVTMGGATDLLTGMLGNGKPGFWGFPALSLEGTPGSFVSRDLDGDGTDDLLVADADGTTISLYAGTPEGPLSLSGLTWDLGFIPGRILVANMDGDPAWELVLLDILAAELVVMDFALETGFTELSRTVAGAFPFFIAEGNLNGDAYTDLLVLTQEALEVTVLLSNGDGTMTTGTSFCLSEIFAAAVSITR